jgi:hypothetical protein
MPAGVGCSKESDRLTSRVTICDAKSNAPLPREPIIAIRPDQLRKCPFQLRPKDSNGQVWDAGPALLAG